VSGFESIIGQDRPIRILTAFLHKGTIPHALLFTGIEGVGKERAAVALAMAFNCAENRSGSDAAGVDLRRSDHADANRPFTIKPCGICKSCRKIDSDNHPDIIRLKPSGPFIKIDQIRALCQTLAMKPYEAGMRVVIISEAQAMNPAAGNALLKMLEEPPARTILILVAAHPSDLLPTIVSRCQHIRFNPDHDGSIAFCQPFRRLTGKRERYRIRPLFVARHDGERLGIHHDRAVMKLRIHNHTTLWTIRDVMFPTLELSQLGTSDTDDVFVFPFTFLIFEIIIFLFKICMRPIFISMSGI